MIQTVRLIREKKDDLWGIYISEFFKAIGCIVLDCVFPERIEETIEIFDDYDVNIFLNLKREEFRTSGKFKKVILPENSAGDCCIEAGDFPSISKLLVQEGEKILVRQIIENVWKDQNIKESIEVLGHQYCKKHSFYYLYNKVNLKFVQEYYPLHERDKGREEGLRKKLSLEIFTNYAECYNELMNKKKDFGDDILSPYYSYALASLKFKLNEIEVMSGEGRVFKTDSLLENIEILRSRYPQFIKLDYLAARTCILDTKYWGNAELYFQSAIEKLENKCGRREVGDFLYYQFANYYEKIKKNLENAQFFYRDANACNSKSYKALYKLAKYAELKQKFSEVEKYCNEIIGLLLNGYEMNQLMPEEQIYVYKSFVLLGDIFMKKKLYDLAFQSYERALDTAKEKSCFFVESGNINIDTDEENGFAEIMKSCMPKQPVYFKLIGCVSEYEDMGKAKQYFEELRKMD